MTAPMGSKGASQTDLSGSLLCRSRNATHRGGLTQRPTRPLTENGDRGDQLTGYRFPECEPSLKPLYMAFQGLGLQLGVVVVPHVVKQAAIVIQESAIPKSSAPRLPSGCLRYLLPEAGRHLLDRDSTLQRPSWVRNLLCLEAVINLALGYGAGRPSRPSIRADPTRVRSRS